MKIHFRERASADLDDIWYFIALDDPAAATRVIDVILTRLKVLQTFPEAGRERPEIANGLRSLPISSYIAFYRVTSRRVEIVRVLHGHQDPSLNIWDLPPTDPEEPQ